MESRRRLAGNVIWNWAGMATAMLSGFVVLPFLVQRLGTQGYGLWIIISSLTSYFGLLDLGIRNSVGRNLAFFRARGDGAQVNAILSTALVLLSGPAMAALVGTGLVLSVFFHLFDVPADQADGARLALVLVGASLALSIVLNVFDAVLWAWQRFDILNAIDIPVAVLRTVLTFALVHGPGDLPCLALITLATTVLAAGLKGVLSFRVEPALRIGPRWLSRVAARTLLGFGIWSWLQAVTRIIGLQIGPLLIGGWLGVVWVTPFSVAARLVNYAASLLMAASGVLTPFATALHATDQQAKQQRLVILGGKYCLALALFFLGFFLVLGDAFLTLWIGSAQSLASSLLVILALGETLPLAQAVSSSTILGMGRHRALALAGLVENGAALFLALLWIDGGLIGISLALAIPACVCRGLFPLVCICRAVQLPVRHYLAEAMWPALVAAIVPTVGLALLTQGCQTTGWLDLIGTSAAFVVAYGSSCLLVFGPGMASRVRETASRGNAIVRRMLSAQ